MENVLRREVLRVACSSHERAELARLEHIGGSRGEVDSQHTTAPASPARITAGRPPLGNLGELSISFVPLL
jgi:hypothetical protein